MIALLPGGEPTRRCAYRIAYGAKSGPGPCGRGGDPYGAIALECCECASRRHIAYGGLRPSRGRASSNSPGTESNGREHASNNNDSSRASFSRRHHCGVPDDSHVVCDGAGRGGVGRGGRAAQWTARHTDSARLDVT